MSDPQPPPAPIAPWAPPLPLLGRVPAHVLNGASVALGVTAVHLLALAAIGADAARGARIAALAADVGVAHLPTAVQWLTSGAILTSLADVPDTVPRSRHKLALAALLGCSAAFVTAALDPCPKTLGLALALIAFVATMLLAWGPRAGPLSFVPTLAVVFTMGLPPGQPPGPLLLAHAAGAALYAGWALLTGALLQRRWRRLALAESLADLARLLHLRARMLLATDAPPPDEGAAPPVDDDAAPAARAAAWIAEEAQLAERLQSARDLVFAATDRPRARSEAAMLLAAIELRDVLLASLLDQHLFGSDASGQALRRWLAAQLTLIGDALDRLQQVLRGSRALGAAVLFDPDALARQPLPALPVAADDPRQRLLPALANRLAYLGRDVARIEALARGADPALPLSRAQLRQFVAAEGWPLAAITRHASGASPVLRHALRMALALGAAYFIALALPWASHPQWLVLSVAVVLRGNLQQTLSRRNVRVAGTLLGCLLALALARFAPTALLTAVFLAAVALAHAFALRFYLVTATAASVMSLLQVHLADPAGGFPVAERVADTVLGALLAWAFSYVLPSWERRALPGAIERALAALRDYASHALGGRADDSIAQRLARRQAYDALVAVGSAWQRSSAEPAQVRPPPAAIVAFIDHGQRLMAHLSMSRLMRLRAAANLPPHVLRQALDDADRALQAALAPVAAAGVAGVRAAPAVAMAPATAEAAPAAASDPAAPGEPAEFQSLPADAPLANPLPWVRWRLQVAAQVGQQVAQAARDALAALRARR